MSNGILNDEEKLTGFRGLLGNLVFPGLSGQPTNKQLIDAAILRGSLELAKPRQPGENFASQIGRSLQAGTQFIDSLKPDLDQQIINCAEAYPTWLLCIHCSPIKYHQ